MNFLRAKPAQPITEEDLIAFHLNELPPQRRRAVQEALMLDAALAAESASVAAMLDVFKDVPMKIDEGVVDRNWEALRPSLTAYPTIPPVKPGWHSMALPGAVLGGVGLVALALLNLGPRYAKSPATPPLAGAHAGSGSSAGSNADLAPSSPEVPFPRGADPADASLLRPGSRQTNRLTPRPGTPSSKARDPVPVFPLRAAPMQNSLTKDIQMTSEENTLHISKILLPPVVVMAATCLAPCGLAQTPSGLKRPPRVETSVSLGMAAQLTATRTLYDNGSQGLTPSVAVLGTVRQSVRPWLGYTVNLGYTRSTENIRGFNASARFPLPTATLLAIPGNVYEASAAYLMQKHITPRLTGFADLGGGVLRFQPKDQTVAPVINRPLGVAGVGVDVSLSNHVGLRAEYRGLLFKYPDLNGTQGRALTESSQPTVSLIYKFGRMRKPKS